MQHRCPEVAARAGSEALQPARPALIFFLTCVHRMPTAGNLLERRLHRSGAGGCTPRTPLAPDHSPGATFLPRTHPGRLPGPPHTCCAPIPHFTRMFSTRTCGQDNKFYDRRFETVPRPRRYLYVLGAIYARHSAQDRILARRLYYACMCVCSVCASYARLECRHGQRASAMGVR